MQKWSCGCLVLIALVIGFHAPLVSALDMPKPKKEKKETKPASDDKKPADSKSDAAVGDSKGGAAQGAEAVAAQFEPMVAKALKGYNDEDYKAFYADYAKSVSSIATEQVFKSMFMDTYKKDLGKFVSKTLKKDQTSAVVGDFNVLIYQAEFEKNKNVLLSVNTVKEDGNFKIMQIRFDKQ